tara:strand:+ start:1653 stop:2135 length:483 start_codon:yes stop_codon:yes gene_type:complete
MRKITLIAAFFGLAVPVTGLQAIEKEEPVDFEKQIYPLIQESCLECHRPPFEDERGRTRKPKSGLVVANKAGLEAGAEHENDAGEDEMVPVIVAGKPEESSFYTLTMLPLSDDDHMPPEDKATQLTDDEKELLKRWIAEGADYGDWVEDTEWDKPKPETE